jgi:preprotein translocase subunit SecE
VSDTAPAFAADGDARPSRGGSAGKPAKARRPGPIARSTTYVRQVVAELRKVIWPTRQELITYTTVVLAFVTVMVLLVSGFDFVFTQGVLAVFGK